MDILMEGAAAISILVLLTPSRESQGHFTILTPTGTTRSRAKTLPLWSAGTSRRTWHISWIEVGLAAPSLSGSSPAAPVLPYQFQPG